MENVSTKKYNMMIVLMVLLAVCSGIIWIFTNVSVDATYQISMAYRIVRGEKWFLEMWEPHQTSAYLNAALMWIYLKITGTTTGIVLYIQFVGILLRGLIAIALFFNLRKFIGEGISFASAILFFMISPKDLAVPEYGNQQLWFYTLLFVFLINYLKTRKLILVFLMSVSTCFLVLSYPSCIFVFIATIVLLVIYDEKQSRVKSIGIYAITCAVIGMIYAVALLSTMEMATFIDCIKGMLSLEPSHTVTIGSKLQRYLNDLLRIVLYQAVVVVFAFLVERIINRLGKAEKSKDDRIAVFTVASGVIMLFGFLVNILSVENRCDYGIIFFFVIIEGLLLAHHLSGWHKTVYICGTTISLACLFATLALTDLPMLVSSAYSILAVGMALIPIGNCFSAIKLSKTYKFMTVCAFMFIFLLFFRAVYIRTPLLGRSQITSIKEDMGLVRVGPAKGIITDEMSAAKERDGYQDFATHVGKGDVVLVISDLVNSLAYLYTDMEIGTPSVMSDPKWLESTLKYYEINPHKYPNVLAVSSYQGELEYGIRSKEWIYNWITNEYGATRVEEGTWWTFYYRD